MLNYKHRNNNNNNTLGIADRTMAQLTDTESIANRLQNNKSHTMNGRDWTDKERVVEIDKEERMKGRNYMKRIKE